MSHMEMAHAEAHRNLGVPMGMVCNWDFCFCDPDPEIDPDGYQELVRKADIMAAARRGENGTATIKCGNCDRIHFSVASVRDCYAR